MISFNSTAFCAPNAAAEFEAYASLFGLGLFSILAFSLCYRVYLRELGTYYNRSGAPFFLGAPAAVPVPVVAPPVPVVAAPVPVVAAPAPVVTEVNPVMQPQPALRSFRRRQ